MIPLDPTGYSVNLNTGTIHTRYADHGNGERTRTERGVRTLLDGMEPKACQRCYGKSPRYAEAPRPPQRRRVHTNGKEADSPTEGQDRGTRQEGTAQ